MLALVAASQACIESNARMLLASRHLLKLSRRVLDHPRLKIRGGSGETDGESPVRGIVRTLLASGALWPICGRVQWAGYGTGQACCVCGQPVSGSQVEYEVEDGSSSRLTGCHFACFVVWYEESRTFSGDGQARS